MSIINVIKDSVREQDKHIVLSNCFHSWDGNVDESVIIQGLHDRLKAMGKPVEGIAIQRSDLNNVYIIDTDGRTLFHAKSYPKIDKIQNLAPVTGVLHGEEEEFLCEWLINNFHH